MLRSIQNKKIIWAKFVLKRQGYDPLIDFLKRICIIFVILNHCMPKKAMDNTFFFFWGSSAVPIFIIIQIFHAYKRGIDNTKLNYKRIWNKIIWPYLLAEFIIFICYIIKDHHFTTEHIINDFIAIVKSGGYGPGAYYPFIYIQVAFILPCIIRIFKFHTPYLCLFYVIISQLSETACSFFHLSQLAYRLLFIRYIFLIYLGFILSYKGYILNIYSFCLAFFCLIFSSYIKYSHHNFSPLLFNFVNPTCHWFCYLFIAFLLLFIIQKGYYFIDNIPQIKKYIIKVGKYSYDVFLFQIVYFALIDEYIDILLNHCITNNFIFACLKVLLSIFLCTLSVLFYKERNHYGSKVHNL